jgi:hypothetical protein
MWGMAMTTLDRRFCDRAYVASHRWRTAGRLDDDILLAVEIDTFAIVPHQPEAQARD